MSTHRVEGGFDLQVNIGPNNIAGLIIAFAKEVFWTRAAFESLRVGRPTFMAELTLRMRREGDRWALSSSRRRDLPVLLDGPLTAVARGAEIVVRGGHPVYEEWLAGSLSDSSVAEWVAEWIAVVIEDHVDGPLDATRRGTSTGYRR
ncbi:MAG: hypothetical protein M3Y87_12730 [Myxococcota bacterium]|nr:hypothetical protein [Myxococcota bacterium]